MCARSTRAPENWRSRAWSARACDLQGVAKADGLRTHRCAKRYTAVRSNRPSAVAAVRKSHVCAFHARARYWRARGARERVICEALQRRT
eukprot:6906847-Lingulodinium_polyedra.AAC.1